MADQVDHQFAATQYHVADLLGLAVLRDMRAGAKQRHLEGEAARIGRWRDRGAGRGFECGNQRLDVHEWTLPTLSTLPRQTVGPPGGGHEESCLRVGNAEDGVQPCAGRRVLDRKSVV